MVIPRCVVIATQRRSTLSIVIFSTPASTKRVKHSTTEKFTKLIQRCSKQYNLTYITNNRVRVSCVVGNDNKYFFSAYM